MFKLSAILIVSLLAIQGYDANPIQYGDIIQDIAILMQNLKAAVDEAVENAVDALKGLQDKLDKIAKGVLEDTEREIQAAAKKLNDRFDKLVKAAVGKDIANCVAEYQPQLVQLPLSLTQDLEQCVSDKAKEGQKILNDTLDSFNNIYLEISHLDQEIEECGLDAKCLTGLLAKITIDVTVLPAQIASNLLKAKIALSTMFPTIAICASGKVAKLTFDGGRVLAKFTKCIAKV